MTIFCEPFVSDSHRQFLINRPNSDRRTIVIPEGIGLDVAAPVLCTGITT